MSRIIYELVALPAALLLIPACTGVIGSNDTSGSGTGGDVASSTTGPGGADTGSSASGATGGSAASTGGSGGTNAGGTSTSSGNSGGASAMDPCAGSTDGSHCGGDLGGLADHSSVYVCTSDVTTSVTGCADGCANGACVQPPMDPCANANAGDGAYCGASLGAGNPDTLYHCQNKMKASEMACPDGCQVQPAGTADNCKPSGDPCSLANAGNGLYCGGNLKKNGAVVGDTNVLYDCQNMSTASQTTCPNGCQEMAAGVADACAPVNGGQCCLNKPPGALTQSYSACGNGGVHYGIDYGTPENTPIYSGMSGTIVGSALGFPNCYDNGCSSACWNSFNYVKIKSDCGDPEHPGNDLFIYYLHINNLGPGVVNGTHLDQGQLLAYSGNSGCSSGPHIHIETATVPAGGSVSLSTCKSENPAARYCQ